MFSIENVHRRNRTPDAMHTTLPFTTSLYGLVLDTYKHLVLLRLFNFAFEHFV